MQYPFGKKGWKVYDLETGDIFVSHDVIFHEKFFSFTENQLKEASERLDYGQ